MPYTVLHHLPNAANNLSKTEFSDLYRLLAEEGTAETLFYDGHIRTPADFADFAADARNPLYLFTAHRSNAPMLVRGKAPLAFCWLNGHSGRSAMIHFAVFRFALSEAEAIGRFATRMLLLGREKQPAPRAVCEDTDGALLRNFLEEEAPKEGFCLDALFGLTPAPFRHAVKFVKRLGFEEKTLLPAAATLIRKGRERTVPCVLTCLTRERLNYSA